jgi:hypothetical protein
MLVAATLSPSWLILDWYYMYTLLLSTPALSRRRIDLGPQDGAVQASVSLGSVVGTSAARAHVVCALGLEAFGGGLLGHVARPRNRLLGVGLARGELDAAQRLGALGGGTHGRGGGRRGEREGGCEEGELHCEGCGGGSGDGGGGGDVVVVVVVVMMRDSW